MFPMMRLPWQWPLLSNGALYIQQLWASGGRTREQILMKFGIQQQFRTAMTVTWSNIKISEFKMADGRHVGKYSKCRNSPTNGPTGMQLGWSDPIMFSTCPPWRGCHGNGRYLAMALLNILQLWVYGSRTREPMLMKFGTHQHVRTIMTVTWWNSNLF